MNDMKNLHDGHRKRVKNKFVNNGIDSFDDHNIIEMLLFYGIPRKDTNEIAHVLINKFGSISGIMDAEIEELCSIDGISYHVASLIKLTKDLAKIYANEKMSPKQTVSHIDQVADYIKKQFMYLDVERFGILGIDGNNNIKGFTFITEGTMNETDVNLGLAVTKVLNKKWSNIVLCHNHPSGNLKPSSKDIATTDTLVRYFKSLGINVIDHLIVCDFDYLSIAGISNYKSIFR